MPRKDPADTDEHQDEQQREASGPIASSRRDPEAEDEELRDVPLGAIAVTTFLAITILVFWFGMYFLNIARSG